jgi:preprotein translocase subunit SecD
LLQLFANVLRLGVAESEVSAQGSGVNRQIVISVPGETGRRIVDLVGQTAELCFCPVLVEGSPTPKAVNDINCCSQE